METDMSKVNIISEESVPAVIISMRSKLDFSKVKCGPNCSGCYSIVFEAVCGHPFTYRKRCQPRGLVCAGSEILTVSAQDIVLRRRHCTSCHHAKKDDQRLKVKSVRKRAPKKTAARMRMVSARERWRRQVLESELADRNSLSSESAQLQVSREGGANHVPVVDLTVDQQA